MLFFWNTKKKKTTTKPISGTILNASSIPLDTVPSNMPNVSAGMSTWFSLLQFGVITKSTVDFVLQETIETISFRGVWQPFSAEQLQMRPEGERSWPWFMVHAEISLILANDSCIIYKGERYRVMARKDYQLNGYIEYSIVADYVFTIPETVTT